MRKFAKFTIPDYEVFYETSLCYAMVNTKPVVPGHVLIVPQRVVERYYDLTQQELQEMTMAQKKISKVVETLFKATSLTFVCQDGKDAGQSVNHVHFHILPRCKGDFERNDDIYDVMEGKKSTHIDIDSMPPRTQEEMETESTLIREALNNWKE